METALECYARLLMDDAPTALQRLAWDAFLATLRG